MSVGKGERNAPLAPQKITLGQGAEWLEATTVALPPSVEDLERVAMELRRDLEQKNRTIEQLQDEIGQLHNRLQQALEEGGAHRERLEALESDLHQRQLQAQAEGYRDGAARALENWRDEMRQHAESWCSGMEKLAREHAHHWEQLHASLTELVMAAVARILGDQMASPEAVAGGIGQIIRESGELGELKVRVAPRHYEELSSLSDLRLGLFRNQRVEILPDARVEYGGCILETAGGLVDGRYEIQLARLRDVLRG